MTGPYYARATKLIGLSAIARGRTPNLVSLMLDAGLDPQALFNPEMRVEYSGFCSLLQLCARQWDMPDIGLRLAKQQEIDFLGPVALVTRSEKTVRGAIDAIIANLVIYSNATFVALEETGGTASVILVQRDDAPQDRCNTELVVAQAKCVLNTLVERDIDLVEASFRHEKGPSAAAVSSYFQCPVRYEAERNALSFDTGLLDRPLAYADQFQQIPIRRYLTKLRTEAAGNIVEMARRAVAQRMEQGSCTLETVAETLQLPPHTLQRRLRAEGTTIRGLVEEWRRHRALSLVTNTRLPLSQVSDALGYSEQSVFTQAFRRWYGAPPKRYRSEMPVAGNYATGHRS
ncbi:HTH-type transcriptional regulator VirS [Roseibium aquae]|uniref:HTH-type transcriptional regulator VirS n=1 Tax=Roseibium aquae TaxID=1323746 RepID=A0A916TMV4_9HYPH|nr:AraC family transcriptional regulator [Roseibium aquae]GGB56993.1 HTH-type transcriptional regulator VirS [Roseibium aquae]